MAYFFAMLIFFTARGIKIPFNEAAFYSIMIFLGLKLSDIEDSLESIRKKGR